MVGTAARVYGEPTVACPTSPKPVSTSFETAVQRITSGVSDNFVPTPKFSKTLEDLLIGLKRFRNSVRWKWFFMEVKRKELEQKSPTSTKHTQQSNFVLTQETEEDLIVNLGLETGVKPKQRFTQAPQASLQVEAFLKDVTRSF